MGLAVCFDIDLRIPGSFPMKILSVRRGTRVLCSLPTWRSEDSSMSVLSCPLVGPEDLICVGRQMPSHSGS